MSVKEIQEKMRSLGSPERAEVSQRFFKTGKGEYAEGDLFIGLTVPNLRKIARDYRTLSHKEIVSLLKSKIHEERLLALLILCLQYAKGDEAQRETIYNLYLAHTKFINNWDLVDVTAPHIVGAYLSKRDRQPLYELAKSSSLWERRIAILATFHFIRNHDFDDSLHIAEILLLDDHDLIHKAVGWMLREIDKRASPAALTTFLARHAATMPRTMLRYAIERLPATKRKFWMARATKITKA